MGALAARFPIIVSQDGNNRQVSDLVTGAEWGSKVYHMVHRKEPSAFMGDGHSYIAPHYKFLMSQTMDRLGFRQMIIVEDDMEVAPDFFSYMLAGLRLLRQDPTLMCVSAWNDNGFRGSVADPRAVFRTDIFPGLGWILTDSLWAEVRPKWPRTYWDEFFRKPETRAGRTCLRPEVNRAYTFGKEGTSMGMFFDSHLKRIQLNDRPVDWQAADLRNLTQPGYDKWIEAELRTALTVSLEEAAAAAGPGRPLRVEYRQTDWPEVSRVLGLMDDLKEGSRRTAYRHLLAVARRGRRLYLHLKGGWPRA